MVSICVAFWFGVPMDIRIRIRPCRNQGGHIASVVTGTGEGVSGWQIRLPHGVNPATVEHEISALAMRYLQCEGGPDAQVVELGAL